MGLYGKYRGVVTNNDDPLQLGRLQVMVPAVLEPEALAWAMPCLQPGAPVELPQPGVEVWVEFEGGDPSSPIWCGVLWSAKAAADADKALHAPQPPEMASLRTREGACIEVGPSGIVLDNGQGARITMAGPTVSINNGALDIT